METREFVYNDEERFVLVDSIDCNGDIYGQDINLLSESDRDKVIEAIQILKDNFKTTYRHFKNDKIKTNDDVKNPEVQKESSPKKFVI